MTVDEAYERISNAIAAGRPAHGYLIVGGVRGMGGELADRVLKRIFDKDDLRAHPDIHRLAPEKKSRIISVESMREKMIDPMEQTSFQGGWKAGVIYGADRLKTESANAFLKTLEEPTPKTLFLLLTEAPEQLLPTIISRCQRIDLPDARARALEEPYRSEVLTILSDDTLAPSAITPRAAAAAKLAAILERLEEKAEELVNEDLEGEDDGPGAETTEDEMKGLVSSRYREFRSDFTLTLMSWFRDMMALRAAPRRSALDEDDGCEIPLVNDSYRAVLTERARKITLAQAFKNVEAVEAFATSLERNMPEGPLLPFLMDRLAFGAERTL